MNVFVWTVFDMLYGRKVHDLEKKGFRSKKLLAPVH